MNNFPAAAFSDKIVGPELRSWPVLRVGILHLPRCFHIRFSRAFDDMSHPFTCQREKGTMYYMKASLCLYVPNGKATSDSPKSYNKLATHVVPD